MFMRTEDDIIYLVLDFHWSSRLDEDQHHRIIYTAYRSSRAQYQRWHPLPAKPKSKVLDYIERYSKVYGRRPLKPVS